MTTPDPVPGPPPDWYPDPTDPGLLRYWDGRGWTDHTSSRYVASPTSAPPRPMVWWQTWWAVIPTLVLCLPVGLVALWRRPAAATWLRVGLTVATVALYGGAVLAGGDGSRTPDERSGTATSTRSDSTPPSTTPSAEPTEPAPTDPAPTESAAAVPAAAEPSSTPVATEPTVTETPRAVMPKVTGLSQQEAEAALAAAGIAVREVRQVPSALPVGTVVRQAKKAGARVRAGTSVILVVAAPYPSVPSVVGLPEAAALDQLQSAGFKVRVTTEVRTSGKDGVVLRQSPPGSELLKPGSTVAVVVSDVVRPVAAPPPQNCTPGYRPCLPPASDYDCAGGSGNGPEYADGPIYVTGSDPYDLDAEGDGIACE